MTLEEALDYVEGNGPLGEFYAQQRLIPTVAATFTDAKVAHDPVLLARVRRLVHKASAYDIQLGLRWCWLRAELTLGNHAAIAEAIWASPYPASFFNAGLALREGLDAWPLARLLLERSVIPRVADSLIGFVAELTAPGAPEADAHFAELCGLSASIAARALTHQRWSMKKPIAERLGALVSQLGSAAGEDIADAIRAAAEAGESVAAIEPAIESALVSKKLAFGLTVWAVREGRPLRWLDDPRPAVRIGVVSALAKDPRLVTFVRDPDAAVRRVAITILGKRGIAAAEIEPLVAALESAGTELVDMLVVGVEAPTLIAACTANGSAASRELAASLHRQQGAPTRACDICKLLPRNGSWSHSSDTPATFSKLVAVAGVELGTDTQLLRCPTCSACYLSSYWSEMDVNSMYESWSLRRFTLGELTRERGAHFAPDWTAALVSDLDHPDPHWRTEAAHDIAVDLVTERQFDRIERELLQHPRVEVSREALRVVSERAIEAPISMEVLERLARSSDDTTRNVALTLIAVRRGALDEIPLDSTDDFVRAELLVDRGAVASAAFVTRLVERALIETRSTWTLDSVVEKTAFTPAHLPATLARLQSALVVAATRHRALELAERLAKRELLDEETWNVVVAQADADHPGTLAVALADPNRPLPPALANATLRLGVANNVNGVHDVVQRLKRTLDAGGDLAWAVAALAENARRFPETYDSTPLLDELAKRGVDLSDAVADLTATLDVAMGYSEQYAARALVRHHMRRGNVDAVVAVLSHPLPSVRGAAIGALDDTSVALPAPIIARLQAITNEPAWYPRGEALSALRVRLVSD